MSELNPCPFCGGQAIMKIQKHIPNGYDYTPTCQDPSCAGRLTKKWVNEADAIEAWNKRMCADHFRDLTKMVATSAEPERKWIPFDVALPKDRQKVLCVNKHDEMMVGGYLTDYGMTFPCYYEKPVAWMPLPEPWRGEE